ncbi:hypothetical protein M3Y94_00527900 [Aphelenchoides besseyi]|nr:hypothetical protein M3Y94_00527900 [Aphelenchoides besseyi]KAI6225906.1 hypothetical protein M3Y95_00746400 [Aphelenchoides besseyi]
MPKKFTGENSKSAAARARKDQTKTEERERVAKQKEDAQWVDDDKNVQKKMQRKEDQERKRQELLAKKQEKAKLLEEEMNSLPSKATAAPKVTKAQIDAQKRKEDEARVQEEEQRKLESKNIVQSQDLLTENVNRLVIEGESARNVDEAISVLGSTSSPAEKHPEKRVKAAYAAFEERRLPELKEEKPTFTLSQLRQLLKKEWQKSPANPLNENLTRILK